MPSIGGETGTRWSAKPSRVRSTRTRCSKIMSVEVKISTARTPDEIRELLRLEKRCFEDRAWNYRQMYRAFHKSKAVWPARFDSRIIGYLALWIHRGRYYIGSVAVDRKFRGQGVASRMMSLAEKYVRRRRRKKIELRVLADNPAQFLYYHRGYRATGFIYPSIVMTKEL